MLKHLVGACSISLALTAASSAQTPAGGEFQVNSYLGLSEWLPSAAMEPDGDFVVVWTSYGGQDGSDTGIFGQRFAASGTRQGGEFRINTNTTGRQRFPAVASGGRHDFVVIWMDGQPLSPTTIPLWPDAPPLSTAIQGQRYDASGSPIGGEFRVKTIAGYWSNPARVGRAPDGSFVVRWDSLDVDGSRTGLVARRFDASGNPLGAEFVVNTYTTGFQGGGDIVVAANGNFVVVWEDDGSRDGTSAGIYGQRFDASGSRLGGEFQVNSYTTGLQYFPSVSVSPTGAFVAAWVGASGDGSGSNMFARRFDATGNPAGADFVVNTFTAGEQDGLGGQVALDARGNFVVTWKSYPRDGATPDGIFAQRFSRSGARRGVEFQVNRFNWRQKQAPAVVSDSVGNFVVVWNSARAPAAYDVLAQRFGGLGPAALTVDGIGNKVLEPGETVDVRPTWRNFNGAAQTFGGSLIEMTGPAGAAYTILDDAGDYGTVANGATSQCADCYLVNVSNPSPRPALHWDASVVESIVPDAQGQQKEWRLHVGRSFTDVSIGSPFYPFIETLLHHGVTGGCGGANYCPSTATTREQMSVLVLLAKEGAGYTPRACGTPMFNDVPASSPFCKYIEELARRGVVSGCGGGKYCPTAAVTREQMSVFALRTLDPALTPPACTVPMFADVPASSPFCRYVEELARRSVVIGCGGGNYCPTQPVTREQMGVFISATFGLTLYGP